MENEYTVIQNMQRMQNLMIPRNYIRKMIKKTNFKIPLRYLLVCSVAIKYCVLYFDTEAYNLISPSFYGWYIDFFIIITHNVLTDNTITIVLFLLLLQNSSGFVKILIC